MVDFGLNFVVAVIFTSSPGVISSGWIAANVVSKMGTNNGTYSSLKTVFSVGSKILKKYFASLPNRKEISSLVQLIQIPRCEKSLNAVLITNSYLDVVFFLKAGIFV